MMYLDSAAVVKLVHAEPESQALRDWLTERADVGWVSSVLVEVESFRALARYTPEAVTRLHPVLDLIDLVDLDPGIRILAQTITPATVRSLDAIHLAAALRLRGQLTSFVTYDKRLADAAAVAGLTVDAPTEERRTGESQAAEGIAEFRAAVEGSGASSGEGGGAWARDELHER